jgi:integrase
MKTKITQKVLNSLAPQSKPYRVHDTAQPGLFIRVLPSGHASYMVTWARNKNVTLGRVGVVTLDQARREAARYLAEAHEHGEPLAVTTGRKSAGTPTLADFLADSFETWAKAHQRDAENSLRAIRKNFAPLLDYRLSEITPKAVEDLRTTWLASGLTPATANRTITRLKGVLTRAVEWGILADHPLTRLKRLKLDKSSRVRYLTADEEKRLRAALDEREEEARAERDSANQWRRERQRPTLPDLRMVAFADHLKPLVLLSINTGMRRGEVFNLRWPDVDLKNKVLTVEGTTAKSGQTRHIPLNREALEILKEWRKQSDGSYVFPGKNGGRLDNVKKAWTALLARAEIEGFRWHDLRHTFASKLVMAGVPLNTVRELLGHSDIAMTLRYAHLASESKAAAVELI